jgi:hypothetical protein
VKTKKRCCTSRPRCKRCPVVLERLERQGLAERTGRFAYEVSPDLTKKAMKAARKGPKRTSS